MPEAVLLPPASGADLAVTDLFRLFVEPKRFPGGVPAVPTHQQAPRDSPDLQGDAQEMPAGPEDDEVKHYIPFTSVLWSGGAAANPAGLMAKIAPPPVTGSQSWPVAGFIGMAGCFTSPTRFGS